MNTAPLVSVIIPTYKRIEQTVAAVESVLSQKTTFEYELTVAYDGTYSWEFAEALWKYPIATIVYAGENHGVAATRNLGVRYSQGYYIAFLDSDDVWKQGKLQKQLLAMLEQGALISHTDETWIRNGKEIKKSTTFEKKSGDIFLPSLKQVNIAPSTVMMTRYLWDHYRGFDESFPVCEDYEFWLRITYKEKVLLIPEELTIKYAGHDDQLSNVTGLDFYRIKALVKFLKRGRLKKVHKAEAKKELQRKVDIFISGAKKRGKSEKVEEVEEMVKGLT